MVQKNKAAVKAKAEADARANSKKAPDKPIPAMPATCAPRCAPSTPCLPASGAVSPGLRALLGVRPSPDLPTHLLLLSPAGAPRSQPKPADAQRAAAANIRAANGFVQAGGGGAPRPAPDELRPAAWLHKRVLAPDAPPKNAWGRTPAAGPAAAAATGGAGRVGLPGGAAGAGAAVPVGAEALLEGDSSGALGKAARKNAKRAERKAAQRAQARASLTCSPSACRVELLRVSGREGKCMAVQCARRHAAGHFFLTTKRVTRGFQGR